MDKKKIFFLISSLHFGGAEKQTIALVNKLDRERFEIYLGYILNRTDLLTEVDQEKLSGLYCFDKKRKLDIQVALKLRKKVREINPDIIVCVNCYPLFYAKLANLLRSSGAKIVTVLHSTIIAGRTAQLLTKFVYRRLVNSSDCCVFVCDNQRVYWWKTYAIREDISRVIHNGVDLDKFSLDANPSCSHFRKELGISMNEYVIAICAAFRPVKRHVDLIQAVAILVQRGVPVKLLLVGDGPEREAITSCIHSTRLDDYVVCAGFVHDVRPYIRVADVIVISSISETFSIAILEAMALGKAIVASRVGGAAEQVIPGVNGYLYEPGNVDALADCLLRIWKSGAAERMGMESRKLVQQSFSELVMVEKYEQLFKAL
jgi:glycosyltransferase involved in cell wall biosynthesis